MFCRSDLKDKRVKETALEGEAEKVRREKQAEALGQAQVIAAKAQEEAMKHVLPFRSEGQARQGDGAGRRGGEGAARETGRGARPGAGHRREGAGGGDEACSAVPI